MTKLSSVGDYERELATLDEMIRYQRSLLEAEPDFALEMQIHSLEQRRATIAHEFESLADAEMTGQEISVIFEGRPVRGHSMDSEFMGKMLVNIQKLVTALVASEDPRVGQAGPFRQDARSVSRLQFAGSFEGSFGMRLETQQEQVFLDGFVPLAPTFDTLLNLLAAGDDIERVLDLVGEIGPRARKQYEDLLDELSDEHAHMRVIWPTTMGRREASLQSRQATRLVDTLREVVEEDHEAHWYTGVLDISNSRHGRFGFITDEGRAFDGVVETGIRDQLRNYYDTRCHAWIATRELRHPSTGAVRHTHRLQELRPLESEP